MGTWLRGLWLLAALALLVAGFACAGDDDDDDSHADDDAIDDDTTDDDSADDDAADDTTDDDTLDDDTLDDDTADDDTPSPYDGMAPAGITIDEMSAIASHMSTGAEYDEAREFEIQQSVIAGVTASRRGFYWNKIEPANDEFDFAGYDVMVDLLTDAGLSPLAMLTRAVDWAAPGGPNEIQPADWADFTGTVAARYADQIDLYEIWNEENSSAFWTDPNPEHYGLLLKAAFTAIHTADDEAVVMLGGLSAFDPNLLDPRGIWNFIARVGEAHPDICDYLDAVAIHPYTFLQQPGPEVSIDWGIYHYYDLRGSIAEARGLMTEIGCGDKPIYLTEMGWPDLLIGKDRQGAYFARGLLLARAADAAGYFWYTFFDENEAGKFSFPTEDWFGLYTNPELGDPVAKPSFLALLGAHQTVGNSRYAGDLGAALGWDAASGDYALAFADDQNVWTIALWHAAPKLDEESAVQVPLPPGATGQWTLYDQEGATADQGDAAAGDVPLTLSGRVQYLRVTVE